MNERIIERVRKLLAMSKDTSSPNEAAIAATRARKLIDEYQLSELDLTSTATPVFGADVFNSGQKTINSALSMLAVGVAKYNDCIAELSSFDGMVTFVFKGLLVDAVCANEMFKYLRDDMYRHAASSFNMSRKDRTAYRLGYASGIQRQVRDLMNARSKLVTSNGTALVACKMQLVNKQFGAAKYTKKKSPFTGSRDAYEEGQEQGLSTSLNRQVSVTQNKRLRGGV